MCLILISPIILKVCMRATINGFAQIIVKLYLITHILIQRLTISPVKKSTQYIQWVWSNLQSVFLSLTGVTLSKISCLHDILSDLHTAHIGCIHLYSTLMYYTTNTMHVSAYSMKVELRVRGSDCEKRLAYFFVLWQARGGENRRTIYIARR